MPKPPIPFPTDAATRTLAEICRRDFWCFFNYAFGAGRNPRAKRWVREDLHKPLADWFQKHVEAWLKARKKGMGHKTNLAVLVHRRIGKTTMITRAGQLWLHVRDPEMATVTGAENTILSGKMLASIKGVLDGTDPHAMFTRLYGNWAEGARTWTGKEVVHSARRNTSRQDPSLSIFGVETSITGSHPDAVFYDDPISYDALSKDSGWIETVVEQTTSMFPALESDALIVWIGTRYASNDHFGKALDPDEEGAKTVIGMKDESGVDEVETGIWHVYFLAGRDKDGKATTPHIWSDAEMDRFAKMEPRRYAAQVLNNPSESETNPITKDQLKQCLIKSEEVPWSMLTYAITCDTAFATGKRQLGKDETVFIVHGYPRDGSGLVYVIEGYGSKLWRAEEFAKRLVTIVQKYRRQGRRITAITDERNTSKHDAWRLALGNFFADANEPMPAFHEFDRWKMSSKRDRIATMSTFWVDGRVKVIENCPGMRELLGQMERIGEIMVKDKMKNDWLDAHADAFEYPLYQAARRFSAQRPPWERGSHVIELDGFDRRLWDDDPLSRWKDENPREPLS